MKPIIKWCGGKGANIPYIRELLPKSFNTYYEPFAGSLAVCLDLNPANFTINDINSELINVYTQIRDNVEDVMKSIQDMGFSASSNKDLIDSAQKSLQIVELVLGGIGMVAFLVAAIGIANTMMMSTYERTKEIGLRMSVGARGVDILNQFLIEAILLSVTGGIIGVVIGVGSSYAIKFIAHWPVYIQPWSIIMSFAVCTFTGVFFGWYPAKKAAQLDPIEALRYE